MTPCLLAVEYEEQHFEIREGESLVFGRGAQLDLDSNRFLGREEGRIYEHDGFFWVQSLSGKIPISVRSLGVAVTLTAHVPAPLTNPESIICLQAGPCSYEIGAMLHSSRSSVPEHIQTVGDGDATCRTVDVPITNEQLIMALALAENQLLDPLRPHGLPTNASAAESLGWSLSRFNRKLDWLCQRFDQMGVPGLKGRTAPDGTLIRAKGRRQRLIDYLKASNIITVEDLVKLQEYREQVHARQEAASA